MGNAGSGGVGDRTCVQIGLGNAVGSAAGDGRQRGQTSGRQTGADHIGDLVVCHGYRRAKGNVAGVCHHISIRHRLAHSGKRRGGTVFDQTQRRRLCRPQNRDLRLGANGGGPDQTAAGDLRRVGIGPSVNIVLGDGFGRRQRPGRSYTTCRAAPWRKIGQQTIKPQSGVLHAQTCQRDIARVGDAEIIGFGGSNRAKRCARSGFGNRHLWRGYRACHHCRRSFWRGRCNACGGSGGGGCSVGDAACIHVGLCHRIGTGAGGVADPRIKRRNRARQVRIEKRIADCNVGQRGVAGVARGQRECHHITRRPKPTAGCFGEHIVGAAYRAGHGARAGQSGEICTGR